MVQSRAVGFLAALPQSFSSRAFRKPVPRGRRTGARGRTGRRPQWERKPGSGTPV